MTQFTKKELSSLKALMMQMSVGKIWETMDIFKELYTTNYDLWLQLQKIAVNVAESKRTKITEAV